jgi:hypothetical protein
MEPRRLPPPDAEVRYGRRAGDRGWHGAFSAAFVAQVAGLSLPSDRPASRYAAPAAPPKGLVTDARA